MIKELLLQKLRLKYLFINLENHFSYHSKEDASYLEKIFDEYLKLANPDISKKIYFLLMKYKFSRTGKFLSNQDMKIVILSLLSQAQILRCLPQIILRF